MASELAEDLLILYRQLRSYQTRIEQCRKLHQLSSEGRVDLWSSRRQWMNSGSLFVKLPGRDIKEIVSADLAVLEGELQRVKELIASRKEELKALDSQIMSAVELQVEIERLEIK